MHINGNTTQTKKAFAGIFLGTTVVGKQDIPIGAGLRDRTYQVPFLVTGVSGVREGDEITDYELLLESTDGSDNHLCVSLDDFTAYFQTGTVLD